MKKMLALLFLAALMSGAAAGNAGAVDEIAQRLTAMSVRQDVPEDDPRIGQTRKLLDKAVKLTHEEPLAGATACSRYAGHLFDAIHERATPLELLEALTTFGKPGKPMNETLQDYTVARKSAAAKSHAEAMAALGKKK
jgi:hypothetical protein